MKTTIGHATRAFAVAAFAALVASAALADGYNVVRAAIEAGATPEYAGGRFAGRSYTDAFPVSALFDGVTSNASTPTNGWVGGIISGGYAEVKLPESFVASIAAVPETATYVVHRFDYGSGYLFHAVTSYVKDYSEYETDVRHAPTAWTLEATTNGRDWTTVDERSGLEWGDEEFSKTFALATPGKFVGFRFTPKSSWRFENRTTSNVILPEHRFDVGLMEIEYLAASAPSASGVLFVTSDYPDENEVRIMTEAGTVSAPVCGYDGERRFGSVTGYTLATWADGAWVDGETVAAQSYEFAADGTAKRLTWHFDEANVTGYRLDAQVVAPGYESFELSPSPDAAGYYAPETVVTVTPVEHAEPPFSYFYRWEGDGVTAENAKTKALTLTMDGPKTARCWFDRAWKRVDTISEVTPLGCFTARNGNSVKRTAVFDGCHAHLVDSAVSAAKYDMIEQPNDTATALSEGGRVNYALPIWASEKYCTGTWGSLLYPRVLPAAELAVGANVTSFGSATWNAKYNWPNLVHVEGMRDVTIGVAAVFAGSPVTNDVMDLMPANVTAVPRNAFKNTRAAGTVVDLPNAVYIGSSAFYGTPVTDMIVTNAALCKIGDNPVDGSAFRGMDALKSIAICATNFDAVANKAGSDYMLPLVPELWFTSVYPEYFVGQCDALGNWWSKSFEKNRNRYIYCSKKQPGWKEHVLPVSEFTAEELALRDSDPNLGQACFGIVTNYYKSTTPRKLAWAVHRASPDDRQTGFVLMVR